MKKFSAVILFLQITILLLYFTSLLAFINPPNYILFPVWLLIAALGFINGISLLVKKKNILLALVTLVLSIILFVLGGLMRLFLTM